MNSKGQLPKNSNLNLRIGSVPLEHQPVKVLRFRSVQSFNQQIALFKYPV